MADLRGFILMPFAPEFDWLHQEIKEAGQAAGVDMQRADDIAAPGVVIEQVKSAVKAARVVVAVCTGQNPNVFFEMGLAWGDHRPILVAGTDKDLPFDIQHFRTLLYDGPAPAQARASLRGRLINSMKAVLAERRPLPRGSALSSPPRPRESARLSGSLNGYGTQHRLSIRNAGTVDIYEVNVEVPEDVAPGFSILTQDLPIDVLRPGEAVELTTVSSMWGGRSIFDITLRGRTPSGEEGEWPVKVSL